MNEFEFKVKRGKVDGGRWSVFLPHQCETWDIAGEGDPDDPYAGDSCVPHAEAVAELEKFIAEAQEALEALKAEREYGGDES